jgi:hypothetical protein
VENNSPNKLYSTGSGCESNSSLSINISKSRACSSRHDGEEPLGTGIPNGQYHAPDLDGPLERLKNGAYDLKIEDQLNWVRSSTQDG